MEKQINNIKHLTEEQYYKPFKEDDLKSDKRKLELALERAWHNRDFEIDKYWSRATYFWAFIAATFAGYIAVMGSEKIEINFKNELAFIIICLGLVFSSAWLMVNLGSKKWQENWEKHIDMLEDYVTGPLYKTVWNKTKFSVSKVNILVSGFVFVVWLGLALIQGFALSARAANPKGKFEWDGIITLSAILTGLFLSYLTYHCITIYKPEKREKSDELFSFERRSIHFYDPER